MGPIMRFIGAFAGAQLVSYFLAGLLARAMGVDAYYPPSPTALSYLKSMDAIGSQIGVIALAQLGRGVLFGIVLSPFRKVFVAMHYLMAAMLLGSIVFIIGYVAASGGMIEHFVFFSEYPVHFAFITLIEVAVQSAVLGLAVAWLMRLGRNNGAER